MAHTRREILGGMATLCVSPGLATGQLATKKGEPSPAATTTSENFTNATLLHEICKRFTLTRTGNHDFPPIVREQTYAWLDQNLQHTSSSKLAPVSGL